MLSSSVCLKKGPEKSKNAWTKREKGEQKANDQREVKNKTAGEK